MMINRNKRGIAVGLKADDGKGILRRMLIPALGEHSREVLAEYGFDTWEIDRLVEFGVVIDA